MDISITSTNVLNWIENRNQSNCIKHPKYLIKFYSPEDYNFNSLERGEVFMSSPVNFNDPYDCKLTFNREDLLKRYLTDWICHDCRKLEHNVVRTDCFDWNDSHRLWCTKDPSPIHHRDDYRDTIDDALSTILGTKDLDFYRIVTKRIDCLLTRAQAFISELAKYTDIGVSCFCNCERPYNIDNTNLMRSHYAKNHQGFCVMYCFDEQITGKPLPSNLLKSIVPVTYTKHRIFISKMFILRYLNDRLLWNDMDKLIDRIGHSLITKSTVWKYENEWRYISNKVKETVPFPYAAAIFIGCQADDDTRERLNRIANCINIPIYQTKLNNSIYKLNNFNPEEVYNQLLYKSL